MEETKLVLTIDTQNAEKNLDNVKDDLDDVKIKVEEVNKEADKGSLAIGNYGQAFESAFDKIGGSIASTNAGLGDAFKQIKNAIPVVKSLNKTALSGLTGIKAAIASTGIGLLIIAVTTLVTHWKEFLKIVGISEESFSNFKKKALGVLADIVSGIVGVGNVIVQYLLTPVRTVIEAFKGLGNVVKDVFTGNWSDIKKHATEAAQGIGDAFKKGFNVSENFKTGQEAGRKFLSGVQNVFSKDTEVSKAADDLGKKASSSFGKAGKEAGTQFSKEFAKAVEEGVKKFKTLQDAAGKVIDDINSEIKFDALKKSLAEDFPEASEKAIESIAKLITSTTSQIDVLNEYIGGQGGLKDQLNVLKNIPSPSEEDLKGIKILEREIEGVQEAIEYLQAHNTVEVKATLVGDGADYIQNLKETAIQGYSLLMEQNDLLAESAKIGLEGYWQNQQEVSQGMLEIDQLNLQNKKNILEQMQALYDKSSEEYREYGLKIMAVDNQITANQKDQETLRAQMIVDTIQTYTDMADSIGGLLGQLVTIEKQNLDQRVENGEISEGIAKKEFERIKKLELAQVWIQTLAGSVGAFLQASASYPPPYGQIIGSITAATVLASGIAQHAQIAATQYGSTNTGGGKVGSSSPSVGRYLTVEPEATVGQSSTLSTAQAVSAGSEDQRVYILESDIQSSNRRVEIRESESTW